MDMFRQSAAKAKGTCSHTFGALDTVQVRNPMVMVALRKPLFLLI